MTYAPPHPEGTTVPPEALAGGVLRRANPDWAADLLFAAIRWGHHPLDESVVEQVLAAARAGGLYLDRRVAQSKDDPALSALEYMAKSGAFRPSRRPGGFGAWPGDLNALLALDHGPDPPAHDHEWMMAFLVAAGADVWGSTVHGHPRALVTCIQRGHLAVAAQLLQRPGMPSVDDVLSTPVAHYDQRRRPWSGELNGLGGQASTLLTSLLACGAPDVPDFLALFPDLQVSLDDLGRAAPWIVPRLGPWFPTAPAERDDLAHRWRAAARQARHGETIPCPGAHPWGAQGLAACLAALAQRPERAEPWAVALLLEDSAPDAHGMEKAAAWVPPSGTPAPVETALCVHDLRGFPGQQGVCSVATAVLFHHLVHSMRLDQTMGSLAALPWRRLLDRRDPVEGVRSDDSDLDTFSGAMAPLLAQTLPGGGSVRGLVALCILGLARQGGQTGFDGLEESAGLLGISDWEAFAQTAAGDAVDATTWFFGRLARNAEIEAGLIQDPRSHSHLEWLRQDRTNEPLTVTSFPHSAIRPVWERLLERCPMVFEGQPEAARRLLGLVFPADGPAGNADFQVNPVWRAVRAGVRRHDLEQGLEGAGRGGTKGRL